MNSESKLAVFAIPIVREATQYLTIYCEAEDYEQAAGYVADLAWDEELEVTDWDTESIGAWDVGVSFTHDPVEVKFPDVSVKDAK